MNTRHILFRSNRVNDILQQFHLSLDPLYGRHEVSVFVEMLFEEYLGWGRTRLLVDRQSTIDQSDLLRFHWALHDLLRYRPIQHIIGHTSFCSCHIDVSPDVLIPRPETEQMVHQLIHHLAQAPFPHTPRLLDLCTGSGCIAIALKKNIPQARVMAVDISNPALEIARRNAAINQTDILFAEADLLSPHFSLPIPEFDLIVSNPPYVRQSEQDQMQPNVLDFEPHQALFVSDDDPLCFYRTIAQVSQSYLSANGLLALEINEALPDDTLRLLRQCSFSPTLLHDFRGKPRFVFAHRS